MFQPAISTAVATDLLVRFPTSARASANDVGVSGSRENDQSGGGDQKACHGFNILLLNDARRQGGPALLKPDTIELMMTNQLPDGVWIRFAAYGALQGRGHGLAGALILEPSAFDHQDARGELSWGGRAGTQWWISPKKNTAGLIMAQREMGFAHPFAVEFKQLAYEAVKHKS